MKVFPEETGLRFDALALHILALPEFKLLTLFHSFCIGPRGMDKLIHDGRDVTISNDGATLIGLLDIVHPAAKTLVDIARSQDNQVGDGTTSVVLTAGELLKQSKAFIEEGMHSSIIIKGYRTAMQLCVDRI